MLSDNSLIDAATLAARLGAPGLRIVDASFKMPGTTPTAREDYARAHIPGAVFFDIDEIADRSNPLPHMFPDEVGMARGIGALGLSPEHEIIVYDSGSWMAAPRVWWMLKSFGFPRVQILDGGMRAWQAASGTISDVVAQLAPTHVDLRFDDARVVDQAQVAGALANGGAQIVDARSRERFEGRAAEPWPGRRSGRMPGSLNLPFGELIDAASGRLKSPEELRAAFVNAGVDLNRPVVTSCGSGVSAVVINLALHRIGVRNSALYDGSWAEWGLPGDLPLASGAASQT